MSTATRTPAAQLEAYAAVAWDAADLVEIRELPTERDGGPRPFSFWVRAADLSARFERLEARNRDGLNVYAGILPRNAEGGTKDADCLPGLVLWADFDGTDPRDAWKTARRKGLPAPSMAVASGHGAHLFWRLTDRADPAELCRLVKSAALYLGADPAVANPSRILRLPGLTNWKPPPAEAVLLHATPDRRYTFQELRAAVPGPDARTPAGTLPTGRATLPLSIPAADSILVRARRYVDTIPGAAEGGRNAIAYRVGAALVVDFGLPEGDALPILAGWNAAANSPPLGDTELRRILANAGRHGKHPAGGKAAANCRNGAGGAHAGPPGENLPRVTIPATPEAADLGALRAELEAQRTGARRTIPLPWSRTSKLTHAFHPGTVAALAGPTGVGKSFFTSHMALAVDASGADWRYLPLEDNRAAFSWRILAILAHDYRMIDDDPEGAEWRRGNLEQFGADLSGIMSHVHENPRAGQRGPDGRTVVPPLPPEAVLDWIGDAFAAGARVVFADPLSQIDFDAERDPWRAEGKFIRKALALAADSGGTLVLVAHTVKRPGKAAALPLTLEDIQGAAALGRLCHTAMILEAHDPKTSSVHRPGGYQQDVEHNRTLYLAKTRNAAGGRQRIAFQQSATAPEFEELGIIAPRAARERVPF